MSEPERNNINHLQPVPVAGHPNSVRVSPHSYLTALLLATFFAAFLFYLELDAAGVVLFAASWILLPFFALNDRVTFDGKRLTRTGPIPKLWAWFNRSRRRLKISDIEQVETVSVRAIKRGGSVMYRYRTVFRGKGISVAMASGGDDYRRIIKSILPRLPENVLDNRSLELRDHLADPKETLIRAEFSRIPSAEALENTFRKFARKTFPSDAAAEVDTQHVGELRNLGNELRLSGHLARALEAFRRALHLDPRDARLLFDFARCLYSFASVERDPRLERKALAMLRLSQRRADDDGELLARLGEWYFQIGEIKRARAAFQRAVARLGDSFRAARGLAEIALRDGKIAHVIHHFAAANRVADTPALRRWSRSEVDYFARLNDDEEYMEMEIGRVNLLETVERSKKTALRIAILAFPAVVVGVLFEDALVANIGWAVSAVGLLIWVGLGIFDRVLAQRIPYHLVETDDN